MRNRVEIKSDAKQLIRVSRVSPLVMSALLVIITFVLERLPMLAGFPFFTAKYVQTCLDAMVTGSYAAVDEMILSMLQQASPFFFSCPSWSRWLPWFSTAATTSTAWESAGAWSCPTAP